MINREIKEVLSGKVISLDSWKQVNAKIEKEYEESIEQSILEEKYQVDGENLYLDFEFIMREIWNLLCLYDLDDERVEENFFMIHSIIDNCVASMLNIESDERVEEIIQKAKEVIKEVNEELEEEIEEGLKV